MSNPPAKRIRFRSYCPRDEGLKKLYEKQTDPEQIVQEVVEQQERVIKESTDKLNTASTDLSKLAPKKPNWDLKRDVARKLEKLERRTQRAILEIVRERAVNTENNPPTAEGDDVQGDGTELANAVDQAGEGEDDSDID